MYTHDWYHLVAQRLGRVQLPAISPPDDRRPAAVALLLRMNGSGPELFFIERAHHPDDPWSGNIGFPGGRRDPDDATLRHTAERETREEVGIDLGSAVCLGRLSDIVGANLPVRVSCFVYGLHQTIAPQLSDEVHDAFWYQLEALQAPHRQIIATVRFGERELQAPAIDLGLPGKMVLWGITYRLVSQFRELLDSGEVHPLPYELPL
jgi:8-oxo-dGTP pyrophosphatase MutT (NUDIX family)